MSDAVRQLEECFVETLGKWPMDEQMIQDVLTAAPAARSKPFSA